MSTLRQWSAWLRWPDPDLGPYRLGITWTAEDNGKAELEGFEWWRRTSARPRDVPLDVFIEAIRPRQLTATVHRMIAFLRVVRSTRAQAIDALSREAAVVAAEGLRPGHGSRYPLEHYKAVAEAYSAAPEGSRYEALAARWPASKSTYSHWVARCRSLGLLPPVR